MKKLLLLTVAACAAMLVQAQPPKGPANKGMTFGEKIDAKGAAGAETMLTSVEKETEVKVKGVVTEVCTEMGCWLKMKAGGQEVLVKMKGHAFFVPLELNGKEVIIKGTAAVKERSVKELRHFAEDAGKSKEDIEKITDPKKEVVLTADGVLVI